MLDLFIVNKGIRFLGMEGWTGCEGLPLTISDQLEKNHSRFTAQNTIN